MPVFLGKPKTSLTSSYEKMDSVTEPPSLPPKHKRPPEPVSEEERVCMWGCSPVNTYFFYSFS